MSLYKVITAVRPRSIASMTTSDTASNIPVGTQFNSTVSQIDAITASHPTMLLIADGLWAGKWVPLTYNNVTYTQLVSVTPPPSGTKHFILKVDGYLQFDGELTPEA